VPDKEYWDGVHSRGAKEGFRLEELNQQRTAVLAAQRNTLAWCLKVIQEETDKATSKAAALDNVVRILREELK
jgi:hypothetical protein